MFTSIIIGSMTSWIIKRKLGCPIHCAIFFFLPVNILSITVTWWPAIINLSTKCDPTNPDPPVTNILNLSASGIFFIGGKAVFSNFCPVAESINWLLISDVIYVFISCWLLSLDLTTSVVTLYRRKKKKEREDTNVNNVPTRSIHSSWTDLTDWHKKAWELRWATIVLRLFWGYLLHVQENSDESSDWEQPWLTIKW